MRFAAALLLLLSGCGGCASVPSHDGLRATALRLGFERGGCSGTSIGPHTILTAKHCLSEGGQLVSVDGRKVEQGRVVEIASDAVTVEVPGITFTSIAVVGRKPAQGDRIRWWGSPSGQPDMFRVGYIVRSWTDEIVIDAQIFGGDSGSGAFDDSGRLVGVMVAARPSNFISKEGGLMHLQFAVAVPIN